MKNTMEQKEYLKKATYKNNIWDFCGNYYRLYLSGDANKHDKFQNFMLLLRWNGKSEETVTIDNLFSKEEYQKSTRSTLPVIKKIVDNLVKENLEEEIFYQNLFDKVFDDLLFAEEIEKISAFVILLSSPQIPYFKLGKALEMDNNRYQERSNALNKEISKAFFVLQYGYTQKTEIASQIYNIVKDLRNDEERIVLIANILGFYTSQIKIISEKLKEKASPDKDIEE